MELWASAPELYAVTIISPSGEQIPRILVRRGASEQFNFIFEGTTITVDYRIDTKETASQLIFFRFIRPTPGLWTIRIFPQLTVTGNYHLWLPLRELTDGNNFFLRSNPEITLTSPSAARQVITVGGYQASNTSIYADSGRGYTITGEIKPDFVAPAVDVYGPGFLVTLSPLREQVQLLRSRQEPARRSCSGRSWIRTIQSCRILPSKIC